MALYVQIAGQRHLKCFEVLHYWNWLL